MDIRVETATPESVAGIVRLMRDFAEYEKLCDYCQITEAKLHDVMFGPDAFVRGIVAHAGSGMIAYALFYRNFASFRGQRGHYLEDLFIDEDFRGLGLGQWMLREVAKAAREDGAERLDFLVLTWNEPAIRFYETLGGHGSDDVHGRSIQNPRMLRNASA